MWPEPTDRQPLRLDRFRFHPNIRRISNGIVMDAILALEDGTIYRGAAFGARATACGEVCFNTAMTGYQEILTDPSYKAQIVKMT